MCAKNHLLIFSSFLNIWENVEWPRFFGAPGRCDRQTDRITIASTRFALRAVARKNHCTMFLQMFSLCYSMPVDGNHNKIIII